MTTKIPVELSSTPGIVDGSNATAITIDSSERVGINDTSPAALFTVKAADNTYAGGFRIEGTDETTALGITHVNGDNFFSGNATDDHLVLKSDGKVGIGTTNPATKLEVNGGIRLSGLNGGDGLKLDLAGSGDFIIKETSTNDVVSLGALQHNVSSNALGIGAAPSVALEVVTSDPRLRLRDNTAGGGSGNGGKIEFAGFHAGSSDGTRLFAEIHGLKNNGTGGDTHGDMIFKVNTGSSSTSEVARFNFDGDFLLNTTSTADLSGSAFTFDVSVGRLVVSSGSGNTEPFILNRHDSDGALIEFRQANSVEGNISVSGSTVSYNGFSGSHDSSGIPDNTELGTVCSTIDELDTYPDTRKDLEGNDEEHPRKGQTRPDHAKIKVSDTVGDTRVYGVLRSFQKDGKPVVNSVGIGSVKVTGACSGGNLLESNGDGTAKVQSDDIVRSKTIGKVTIGNSETGVKLVSCVLYCG